jgi:hypothetical protein
LRKRNESVQQADRYKWLWFDYDETVAEENEILTANGKNRFEFTFSGGCLMTVIVRDENREAVWELKQTMPMEDESVQRYFF